MTAPTPVDIRQILFAMDFSAHSERAFRAALALAQHFGARLHLIHVVHRPQEQEAARARLQAFAEEHLAAEPFAVAVAVGTAAPEIVGYADREKADLIVMGTHGRRGWPTSSWGAWPRRWCATPRARSSPSGGRRRRR